MKKIISMFLVSVILLCLMPFTAFAGGDEVDIFLDTPYTLWLGEDTEMCRFTPSDDGWYNFATKGSCDTYATLYNSQFEEITWGDDMYSDTNFSITYKLYAGYTYYIEVGAYVEEMQTVKFELIVTETVGVEDVSITKEPDDMSCIIGLEYDSINLDGMQVTLTLSDGEEVLWTYNQDGDVLGNIVYTYIDDDGYGNYYLDVLCGEGFDRLFFDMIENPVQSISVYSMDAIEIYEKSSGYVEDGNYIYDYSIPDDTQMQINYTDGTNEVVPYYGETDTGFYFSIDDDQFYKAWGIGDHEITIEYMGCTTAATVTILPCPYESVQLITPPSRVYIYGDSATGYVHKGDYIVTPYDLAGLSFELGYSDGTKEVIDADDIDMDSREINGYMYQIDEYTVSGPCDLLVTLSYKGMDISYNVEVVESPVDSIEVLKAPDKYEYEDRYYADYSGMEIKVSFKDGTDETVVLSDENMQYVINGTLSCQIPVRNGRLILGRVYDDDTERYYTIVSCLGTKIDYNGIKYTDSRDVESIIKVENFAQDTDGMIVYVEYSSGVEEILTYSPVDYYDYGDDMYEGFSKTENGITYFDTAIKSKDENSTVYRLYTLNTSIDVEVPNVKLGDVDGDGNVTVLDATLVQRHVAMLGTLSDHEQIAADVDKDNLVTVMDATIIQRYVAGIIAEF